MVRLSLEVWVVIICHLVHLSRGRIGSLGSPEGCREAESATV